jgi:hypothetical protein
MLARIRVRLKSKYLKILELGDVMAKKLASDGNEVLLVDLNPDSRPGKNLTILKQNIAEARLPASYFDVAVSISTIEHIGLGAYNTPIFIDGDLMAIKILHDALKVGGAIIFTLPYGTPGQTSFRRVYDYERLIKLLNDFREYHIEFLKFDRFRWRRCSEKEASTTDSRFHVRAVALVHATK